ncbi:MAG: hypothetical protein ACI8PP_002944 [Candidatus Pseudothioglobus sp.]|jgi:hypothetical protein|tara:strand:+ start:199 stop:510 length:312 start_codon:yes stop_codon:yes gene_type:complete
MKAYVIKPESQIIEPVDIASLADIQRLIGFDTLEMDDIGDVGDRLYFDEECFLRGTKGRFKLDNLVPVSGIGIVIGITGGGKADTLQDVQIEHQELAARIKYL